MAFKMQVLMEGSMNVSVSIRISHGFFCGSLSFNTLMRKRQNCGCAVKATQWRVKILSRRGHFDSDRVKRSHHSIRQGRTKLLSQASGNQEKPVYMYVHRAKDRPVKW